MKKEFFSGLVLFSVAFSMFSLISLFSLAFVSASSTPIFYESFDDLTSIQNNGGVSSGVYGDIDNNATFIPGVVGNAANFSMSKKVCYPLFDNFNETNGTIQFFIRSNSSRGFFDIGYLSTPNSWGIFSPSGSSVWMEMKSNINAYSQNAVSNLQGNEWYLVSAAFYKVSTMTYFKICSNDVCSSFVGRDNTYPNMSGNFCVGWSAWYSFSNSAFDELKIYDYAKTNAEIKQDYQSYMGVCSVSSECGSNGLTGNTVCQGNDVYKNYMTYSCNNPATPSSSCSNSSVPQFVESCSLGCSYGKCNVAPVKSISTGDVRVVGRELFVNGSKYKVKSVGYAPTPIGASPDYGYDVTVHPELRARDFPLIRQMGVNTIRTWGKVGEKAFLDDAWNSGNKPLRVIMGFWMGNNRDYTNSIVRDAVKKEFRDYVTLYKDNPAVLVWAIGNEENYFYGLGDNTRLNAYFSLMNEMAQDAYTIEGAKYHPVMVVSLEFPNQMTTVGNSAAGAGDGNIGYVDMWGINHYPGNDFSGFFSTYQTKSSKPLIVTEYGIDSFNQQTGAEYQNVQAAWNLDLWNQIDSSFAVGGSLMSYSDEFWKAGNPSTHDNGGYATTSHPDSFSNEEWWGIVSVSKNLNGGIGIVTPKKAYSALQSAFLSPCELANLDNPDACKNCVIPIDGMNITSNTTFCKGAYSLPNGINLKSGTLDCNGATILGNGDSSSKGVYFYGSNLVLKNCIIKNFGVGVYSWAGYKNQIINSSFSDSYTGIYIESGNSNILVGNKFYNNTYGASFYWYGMNNTIEKNYFENNSHGLVLTSGLYYTVVNNNIFRKNGYAVSLYPVHDDRLVRENTISNNTIENNNYGIYCQATQLNKIYGNNIVGNNYGISFFKYIVGFGYIYPLPNDNLVYRNNFINNNVSAYDEGINSWNYSGQGNYWSNYDSVSEGCVDLNNNYLCDSPYIVNASTGSKDSFAYLFYSGWILRGDVNLDCQVSLLDYNIIKSNFGKADALWSEGDINGDGQVSLLDYNIVKNNFGNLCSPISAGVKTATKTTTKKISTVQVFPVPVVPVSPKDKNFVPVYSKKVIVLNGNNVIRLN